MRGTTSSGGAAAAADEQGSIRLEVYGVEITGPGRRQAIHNVYNAPQLRKEARPGNDKKHVGSGLAAAGSKVLPSSGPAAAVADKYKKTHDICTLTLRYYDQFRAQLRVDVAGSALIPIWTERGYLPPADPPPPPAGFVIQREDTTPYVPNPRKRRRTEPRVKNEVVDLTSRFSNTVENPVVLSDSD